MKNILRMLCLGILSLVWTGGLFAQDAESAPASAPAVESSPDPATTAAAAALKAGVVSVERMPDFIEHVVDLVLALFGVKNAGNTWQHYAIAGLLTVGFYVLRKVVTRFVFGFFKKLTARTETTLDDELFAVWTKPVAAFIAVLGAVLAIKVLKLSPEADNAFRYLTIVSFSVVALWLFLSTISAILDHLQEVAKRNNNGVAAFMPWIKKAVITLILVFGVLMVAQALGANVRAFLAGLGIGGLAFALAAQDTLANMFGSVVVAVDQPFRIGDFVQIGSHQGTVEDIGLRSTRLRTPDRTLISIPNKTVASDAINNFTRMPQRRVVQTIGVTYGSKSDQINALVGDIRELLKNDPDVHPQTILVHFLNYGACSLDIQIIYFSANPDAVKTMDLRHRMNLSIMRLVEARGLGFAFPTQTIEFAGEIAERMVGLRKSGSDMQA